jgi:DNA-binding Lrp family transcriptional regulator
VAAVSLLKKVQEAASSAGLLLPLSLGAEGSCRIGGNIGTNAGGLSVVRYGMTRDLLLGIEAVLPDGTIVSDMRKLRKDNTGYDIKQCFVGSEGTLGIVTGAVLRLAPLPVRRSTAWLTLAHRTPLAELLALVRRDSGELLTTFEFMTARSIALASGPAWAHAAACPMLAAPGRGHRMFGADWLNGTPKLDRIDLNILVQLQKDGRMTNANLADAVGLSASPCLQRVKRLEASGYITGYGAQLNLAKLTESITVFTEITLIDHRKEDFVRFEANLRNVEELMECHLVSGGYDYLLRFVSRNINHYQGRMENLLERNIGIEKYFSYIVLKSPIVKNALPLKALLDTSS